MARERKDFLTQVREQAERTLAALTAEIRRREAELEALLAQVRAWRDALASSFSPAGGGAPAAEPAHRKRARAKASTPRRRVATGKRVPTARRKAPGAGSRGGRVDWDSVLASLPRTFSIDDVVKTGAGRTKGRRQVYPAINRWVRAKKVRKVGTGRYKRVG